MNIKIITFNRAHNYGAVLQVYALQEELRDKLGNNVKVVDYRNNNIEQWYKPLYLKKRNIKRKIRSIVKYIIYHKSLKKRYATFNEFIENKLSLTKSVYCITDLCELKKDTDVFITGSDQVWSKKIVGEISDVYTLNFENGEVRKISYAASVGDSSQISINSQAFKEKISQIDFISVREEDAKEELEKIIDKPIQVVLDPTLLLTKKEWEDKVEKIKVEGDKYILAYVVDADEQYIKIVNDLSEKTGLKVIHFGMKNPGYKNVLKSAYTEGPLEFVNYIKNAEYVVATSFHATVFSIIFNKKFFIIPHRKTGARVTNLLDKLEIKNRTFNSLEEFKSIDYNFETDWEKVNKNLAIEREKSLKWLENAINSEKGTENV